MGEVQCEPQVLVDRGFEPEAAELVAHLLRQGRGLLYVCGPPRSGRQAVLHHLLAAINRADLSVVAAEREAGEDLDGVTQISIDADLDTDFATWIDGALRADADVIMLGELRTLTSVMSAVRAASRRLLLVRHDGLSSMAPLVELLQQGAPASLICQMVRGAISVRSLPCLCPACRRPIAFRSELFERFPPLNLTGAALSCYEAPGCDACAGTGWHRHVAISEVVSVGLQMLPILERQGDHERLLRAGQQATVLALLRDGLRKMDRGLVSAEQVVTLGEGVSFDLPATAGLDN